MYPAVPIVKTLTLAFHPFCHAVRLKVGPCVQLRLAATFLLLPWVLLSAGAAHAAVEEGEKATDDAQQIPGQSSIAPDKPVARVQGVDQSTLNGKLNSLLQKAKEKLFFRTIPLPAWLCSLLCCVRIERRDAVPLAQ